MRVSTVKHPFDENHSASLKYEPKLIFKYFFCILSIFITFELLLEYRHYRLGYDTPILGVKDRKSVTKPNTKLPSKPQTPNYGPTEDFPFRSKLLSERKENIRVWIASASHAVGGRISSSKIFPNMLCAESECDAINGSQAGYSIQSNNNLLKQYAKKYKPDIAVLYQMSMFMASESNRLNNTKDADNAINSNPIVDFRPLKKYFQQFSLYIHLTDLIGGNIELNGQLKAVFPEASIDNYRKEIQSFIETCNSLEVVPVLSTFVASHDLSNLEKMPRLQKTNFVKWVKQPYLSPRGWVSSVELLNQAIFEVGEKYGVQVVDLTPALNGKPEYFIDFVHFNEQGHKIVARELRHAIAPIIEKR